MNQQNTFVRFIVEHLFGTLIRHGISALGVLIAAKGIGSLDDGTQTNLTNVIIGAICILGPLAWSSIRSKVSASQISQLQNVVSGLGFSGRLPTPPTSLPPAAMFLFAAFMSSAFIGCAIMSTFDQNSYDAAQSLKSASLSLLQKANEPASQHTDDIEALKVRLSSQLSYEEGKGRNNLTSSTQWEVLVSVDNNLLGKLLADWQAGKTFSDAYLTEKRQQIADAFDQIIRLEGAKNH